MIKPNAKEFSDIKREAGYNGYSALIGWLERELAEERELSDVIAIEKVAVSQGKRQVLCEILDVITKEIKKDEAKNNE